MPIGLVLNSKILTINHHNSIILLMDKTIFINSRTVNTHMATKWAITNFGDDVTIDYLFPNPYWRFIFQNPEQATLFALKWSK